MTDLATLTHLQLEECIEQCFEATDAGDEPVELVLTEVRTRGEADPAGGRRQAFSVLFAGPAEPALEQRMYTLQNETLGELAIFLVPVGLDGGRMLYEAVFT
jgi:hypothetical protein